MICPICDHEMDTTPCGERCPYCGYHTCGE